MKSNQRVLQTNEDYNQKRQIFIPQSQKKLHKVGQLKTQMARLLVDQEQRTLNRINLFNKTSNKMMQQRERQIMCIRRRLQRSHAANSMFNLQEINIDNKMTSNNMESKAWRKLKSQCSQRRCDEVQEKSAATSRIKEISQLAQKRRLSKKQNEELIAKSKQKELRKNLKSAKTIRAALQHVKSTKELFFEAKINSVKEQNKKSWQKDFNQYLQRFKRIEMLKKLELRALTDWKKNKQAVDEIYNQIAIQ